MVRTATDEDLMRDRVRAHLENDGRRLGEIDIAFRARYRDWWYHRRDLLQLWDKLLAEALGA